MMNLLCSTKVLFDINTCIGNMFLKSRVIDGETIVKITGGIVKHVYEVILLRLKKKRGENENEKKNQKMEI